MNKMKFASLVVMVLASQQVFAYRAAQKSVVAASKGESPSGTSVNPPSGPSGQPPSGTSGQAKQRSYSSVAELVKGMPNEAVAVIGKMVDSSGFKASTNEEKITAFRADYHNLKSSGSGQQSNTLGRLGNKTNKHQYAH